ncbi:DNA polymerase-1 [Cryobacterium mesophilum]|uniref:DNA polymerase I n=1 Tax=Terrimesophilobacter mesophilus TaxID=433647 RepID=A0A4R8V930_9MICO|nr:DNA polymerase I [Terrimesophilobacter mesophilus]MBB5631910.1 DNA polymerase-1 [Terrimesophilobacter mesophilus]TFB78816.1 DNA polymerase I [Terrimesophilobacter mesophilus]
MSDTEKPTLMVIDGHSLAFRAFYALPVDSFVNREGQHTNAIHGFIAMLINLLQNEKPTHLVVAFDISRYSFRTREYPEYKGTRAETPPEFIGQVPLLEEALKAMGIATISKEDFEADDILATLSTQGADQGFHVYVVSGDRDSIQLVNDTVTLLYPNARGVSELKRYDPPAVLERYGIRPEQYPDIAALVGETSDNLVGVDKVGEKTAVKWVLEYGGLDEILAHADEIKGVVGEKLREQKDRAIRNRKLNRLVTNVDLPVGPKDLERRPIDTAAVREVFDKLQFRTLLDRVLKIAAAESGGSLEQTAATTASAAEPPVKKLVDEELAKWIAAATKSGAPLGLIVETADGALAGLGIATADDTAYVPWGAHRPDYAALEAWLVSDAPKHLFDSKRAVKALAREGITLGGIAFDTSIAAWLLKPGGKVESLAGQIYTHLGETVIEVDQNQLVPENEGLSPATEAWYVLRVADELAGRLSDGSKKVLDEIELPLVPVLARIELDGVAVDAGELEKLNKRLTERAAGIASNAFEIIGREVNLGSPKQLQQLLFDELGMPKTRATKTGYSTDAAALADLQDLLPEPHPFLDLLLQHRDATKLKQMIETLEREIGDDGRIHTTYGQVGTSTGRISSNDPNLQNIPVKTAEGREIRAAFQTGKGFETLLTADYSQIEMRIMAHLSGDAGLIEAFNAGEDLHRFVGARIFGVEPSEVTPVMRTKVKAMSYGLAYGLSAFGLSKQLRIDVAEAKQLMVDYFTRFGAVRDYLRNVVAQAKVDGYTETIFGRRRPFGDLNSNNRVLRENAERQALNAPIQGSAADIIKIAMLGVASDIREQDLKSRMLLQVHDELVFEVAPGELDVLTAIVRDRMGHAADLSVPLDVQVGTGPNWDAAAH